VWFRPKPKPLDIPPYAPVAVRPRPKEEPSVIVDEVDTTDMTKTGVFRAWNRLAGRFK
jgi:hypothetical protein